MKNGLTSSLATILVSLVLAAAVAWAVGDGGASYGGVLVVYICAAIAFAIQWVAFVPAYLSKSERFYDATGTVTYLTVIAAALAMSDGLPARSLVLAGLIGVWALRLGIFLFRRIRRDGKDGRFDTIKTNAVHFLATWTLQGLWVFLTLAAALAVITADAPAPLSSFDVLGVGLWGLGFAIEVVADRQKGVFRGDPDNQGAFIASGLWSWSRHPNYFGEILLWLGIAVVALPTLDGWRWLSLISPVFVFVLLTRVSGVPLLEKRADARWGGQPDYEAYKARTSVLLPLPPRRHESHS